jgi:hypothetical protein
MTIDTNDYAMQVVDDENNSCKHVVLCSDELIPVTKHLHADLQRLLAAGWEEFWVKKVCVDY